MELQILFILGIILYLTKAQISENRRSSSWFTDGLREQNSITTKAPNYITFDNRRPSAWFTDALRQQNPSTSETQNNLDSDNRRGSSWFIDGLRKQNPTTTEGPNYIVNNDNRRTSAWFTDSLRRQHPTITETQTHMDSTINDDNDICGIPVPLRASLALPLMHNGTPSPRADNPWLVGIFQKKPRDSQFICGGSLINNRTVISAAHCFYDINGDKLEIADIILHIGQHSLSKDNEYVIPVLQKIIHHTDYKRFSSNNQDADIAMVILRTPITYSSKIRPICLWQGSTKLSRVVSREGTVVGWGLNEQGILSDIPYKVDIPIVSHQTCNTSHRDFQYIISNRTFCAGRRDGVGPCKGDSGGSFALFQGGRWFLRGIVSASLPDKNTNCDLYNYIVFTDVAKYLEWINSYL